LVARFLAVLFIGFFLAFFAFDFIFIAALAIVFPLLFLSLVFESARTGEP